MSQSKGISGFVRGIFHRIFIDGLSGMALGLFSTLIVGTILAQIGTLFHGEFGTCFLNAVSVAKSLTGAGIAVGVAYKYKRSPLVTISSAVAGMVGAFASKIIDGSVIVDGAVHLVGPGEPLGAFVAALAAAEIGHLVSGKTKLDIILTPMVTIAAGSAAGLLVGPPISHFMTALGDLINWGAQQQPLLMGIVVSVLMGMALTMPISSAALAIILGLSGIAGGAAVVGCATQMVGFAVISYRENRFGGLIAQGLGTSKLQMSNIAKNPLVWVPTLVTSAILGPISSKVLGMMCGSTGAGMGTSGLVGPIITFQTMSEAGKNSTVIIIEIIVMYFVAPALLSLAIAEPMRRKGLIKQNDLLLELK